MLFFNFIDIIMIVYHIYFLKNKKIYFVYEQL